MKVGLGILISCALFLFTENGVIASSCSTYGNTTYCDDGTSYSTYGNTTYGSDGTSYSTYGNTTYGSDGSSYNTYGNTTYGSGNTYSSCPVNSSKDSLTGKCSCNYGYSVDSSKTSCMYTGTTYAAPATPICPLNSYYDGVSSCKCNYGYIVSGSSCVSAATSYPESYGYPVSSYSCPPNSHTSTTDSTQCQCDTGYQVNSDKTACAFIYTPPSTTAPTPAVTGTNLSSARPADYGLKEGDTISSAYSGDSDIFIVNDYGYKRLFLNPAIFSFYGHLGGFANVRSVSPAVRDAFKTSGLFKNCEVNDGKVYAIEVTGGDTGMLHLVDSSVASSDPEFSKKVFCINNTEFAWYPQSSVNYTSLSQIPSY